MQESVRTIKAMLDEYPDDAPVVICVEGSPMKWRPSVFPDDDDASQVCLYLEPDLEDGGAD